jgi:flagellar hook assembly protein FlgD
MNLFTMSLYKWRGPLYIIISMIFLISGISETSAQPALVSPADGAVTVPRINTTFQWDLVLNTTGLETYRLQVSEDVNFAGPMVFNLNIGHTTSQVLAVTLDPYTTYYWRVRSSIAPSPWSAVWSFRSIDIAPTAATNLSPNGSSSLNLTPTLTWNSSSSNSTVSYTVHIQSLETMLVQSFAGVTSPFITPSLAPGGSFQWWVEATNEGGSTNSAVRTFHIVPDVPVLVFPADGQQRISQRPVFDWEPSVQGATPTLYTIQITPDPTFYFVAYQTTTANSELDFEAAFNDSLHKGSPYYWRVRASRGSAQSAFSAPFTFRVASNGQQGPQTPKTAYPFDGETIYNDEVTLKWHLQYQDPDLVFDVDVAEDDAFTVNVQSFYNLPIKTQLLTDLILGKTYYWRVRSNDAVDTLDISPYSEVASFEVSDLDITPILAWPVGGGNVWQKTQTLSWYLNSPAPVSTTYDLVVSNNPDLSLPINTQLGLTNRFFELTNLVPGLTYYWQVTSHVGSGTESSTIESFIVVQSAGVSVPIPSWPINGNQVYTNFPRLNWYVNSHSLGLEFDIRISTDMDDLTNNTAAIVPVGVDNYYDIYYPLLSDVVYYWDVRSKDGLNSPSAFSVPQSFYVAAGSGNAVIPVLSWPIQGNNAYSNTPTLSWYLNTASTGLHYLVRFATSIAGLGAATFYASPTTSFTVPYSLQDNTIYYWQALSIGAHGPSSWSAPESFIIIPGSGNPVTPIASWPIGGTTIYSTSTQLNWYANSAVSGLGYSYEVSTDPGFGVLSSSGGVPSNTNNVSIIGLVPGETYYWRVRTYNLVTLELSPFSNVGSFVVYDPSNPLRPFVGSPDNDVILNMSKVNLSWYLPAFTANTLVYNIELATEADFSNAIIVNDLASLNNEVSNLQNGNYYWRVRSKLGNGTYSSYSHIGKFKVDGVTSAEDNNVIPTVYELSQNYPNPFNPSTILKYSIPEAGNVSIKVYDILGNLVKTVVNDYQQAGSYNVSWNGENANGNKAATGTYIARIQVNGFSHSIKMLLIK